MKTTLVFHRLNNNKTRTHLLLPPWTSSSLLSPCKSLISPSIPNHYPYNGDLSFLISICGRNKLYHLGTSLHASIIKSFNLFHLGDHYLQISIVVWNSLLSFYCKCGELGDAGKMFDGMPVRDTISWNSMISGYFMNGDFKGGFGVLKRMRELGIEKFDQATFTSVLSAFDGLEFRCMSQMMHGLVFVSGYVQEVTVGNALVTSYFKCGCFGSGKNVFDEMYDKNVVTWTAVISGFVQNQFYEEGLTLFLKMRRGLVIPNNVTYLSSLAACAGLQALSEGSQIHGIVWKLGIQSDLCIESALMDLYSKCGNMQSAWKVFESAEKLDMISVTVMLVGFAQNGYEEEALHFFLNMVKGGYEIDPNMVSSILGVFGVDTSLALGQQIHSLIIKRRFELNPFVSNGLINMYSKCGGLEDSTKVFNQMPHRNSVSWNSMIAAFARHGNALKALQLHEDMKLDGVEPTDITFLSLIHACSHVGLVEKGMQYLDSMTKIHGIYPRMEHYACVVDMLGRAGLINEAKSFIEKLPEKPNALVWQALLGACGIYNDSEMGKYAAEQLYYAAPENPMSYILLANIYSSEGRWKDRARTIKKMKEMGVSKVTGISWIEIDKRVHSFVVEDRKHPQAEMMYDVLADLFQAMIDEGYVPDKRFILYQLEEQ